MITCAKAISRKEMASWADGYNEELSFFLKDFDKIWVVSISDADTTPLFFEDDMTICVQFDDIEPDIFDLLIEEFGDQAIKSYFPISSLCQPDHAKKIVDFIKKAHADAENGKDILLVNCHAGISRSGATAEFTADYCNLNLQEFIKTNPHIYPNKFVLNLLKEAAK